MKKLLFILVILSVLSCKESDNKTAITEKAAQEFTDASIEITPVLTDSISVRALDYGNGNYWYAGSKGSYGSIDAATGSATRGVIKLNEDEEVEFRSIATTPNYTYILTAGNPALVYKITQKDGSVEHVYTEVEDRVFYDSMKFWNDEEGIAMGDPMGGCFSVIKTYDGGKTWGKLQCTEMPDYVPGEAAFAASNSNIKILGDQVWLVTGGAMARILYSDNRGSNWQIFNTPFIAGGEMTGIYAVDFYDKDLGVIIGGDWNKKEDNTYNKAITRNGGKSWNLISNGDGPGYCSDIIFIPDTGGKELLAVGTPGIWWSKDQGATWKKMSEEGFYTVRMIDSSTGYLAGNNRISSFTISRK
ncbi:MAG: WD40/YVTN/BNR-like repeat-containing protein [Nonlabens sp.]|uniref:WD40/YVTN/BNR-like repeat-containing protein n=1 Tax=Nonlabens sp. TaxID=1888209 RepID=UPI003EF6FFCD